MLVVLVVQHQQFAYVIMSARRGGAVGRSCDNFGRFLTLHRAQHKAQSDGLTTSHHHGRRRSYVRIILCKHCCKLFCNDKLPHSSRFYRSYLRAYSAIMLVTEFHLAYGTWIISIAWKIHRLSRSYEEEV
jgi:hypothetical protein